MSNQTLLDHEDRIDTTMGGAFLGERVVFRGKDLHAELGDRSWLELWVYGITGRFFAPNEVRLLNYIWVSTSYPEPRIWCNRIAALAGSARTTATLGLSAALNATEATLYGHRPVVACLDLLQRTCHELHQGATLASVLDAELLRHRQLFGYGRPLASVDERVPRLLAFMQSLSIAHGEHLRLAFAIEDHLIASKQIRMNIVAVYSGIAADLGFTPNQYHQFMVPMFFAGMPPCFIDAQQQPEGAFLPIRCARAIHDGPPRRHWSEVE
jgi:hypothetical protein